MSIDDPGMKGGSAPDLDPLPRGDHAGDTGAPGEPQAAHLDMPGPDDPVAWTYVEAGTDVVGSDGKRIGVVKAMLGTEAEGIFHGIAVDAGDGPDRVIPADLVTSLTSSRVEVDLASTATADLEAYEPVRES
ncbi:MAG: PRC-barrel domain-containing protein [Chloroflexota bacterium]